MKKIVFVLLLFLPAAVYAHSNVDHNKKLEKPDPSTAAESAGQNKSTNSQKNSSPAGTELKVTKIPSPRFTLADLSYSKFPTLHPMIVHFPVTLIPLAFIIYLIGMILKKNDLKWTSAFVLLGGLLFGFAAAFPYHPHTANLSESMQYTLKQHDYFAYSTLTIASIGLLFAILSCVRRFSKRVVEVCTASILLLAVGSITITGHYGGTLTHVHGIGPQGKYLENSHK